MGFDDSKQAILGRLDKSKKGDIDTHIRNLCSSINATNDYFTVSSCSGRIALLKLERGNDKRFAEWLLVTHELADASDFKDVLNGYDETHKVFFKQESVILHVCCRTLDAAQSLVDLAKANGFKRSGIFSTRKKIRVELISAEQLSAPVFDGGKLITDDYLEYLINHANKKLKKSWDAIERLEQAFQD